MPFRVDIITDSSSAVNAPFRLSSSPQNRAYLRAQSGAGYQPITRTRMTLFSCCTSSIIRSSTWVPKSTIV